VLIKLISPVTPFEIPPQADTEEDAMTDVGDGQMADDGGQCFETTVRWDSLKELDPFMGSDAEEDAMTDVGDGQMADDGGQCFETTVRWDSLKELDPFMGSDTEEDAMTDVGDGQMADDGGQCSETTVRWDSLKELDPFMGFCAQQQKIGKRNNLCHSISDIQALFLAEHYANLQFLEEINTE